MTSTGRTLRAIVAEACRGRVIGVEREYGLRDARGDAVDARRVWDRLPDPGVWLDPGDPRARRGGWGGVITADGPHAELATPPVALAPGCTHQVLALAAAGERHLVGQVSGLELVGYSTHINVEVADRRVARIARLLARRLALPIMLALDRPGSPGLLVRPRRDRLEIGGEFAAGDQLRIAVAMTVGMVTLAERSLLLRRRIPHGPEILPERAVERYGWYVDRRAFGPDLYLDGRDTRLGAETAGQAMGRLWAVARRMVRDQLSQNEIGLVDAAVSGARPLPLEDPVDDDGPVTPVRLDRSYAPRRRRGLEVTVHRATWWKAVLGIRRGDTERWLTLPGRALDAVLDAVDADLLDEDLVAIVRR